MEQFKRTKVIMLPTKNRPCLLNLTLSNKLHLWNTNGTTYNPNGQHLYIISDDEIKENNWCIVANKDSSIYGEIAQHDGKKKRYPKWKKIIATTDTSLNTQNINNDTKSIVIYPQPSQQFIEKYIESYNKGEIITDILVEYMKGVTIVDEIQWENHELYLKVNPKDNTITIRKLKDSWNKEEIIKLIEDYSVFDDGTVSTRNKWINNNL